MAHAQPDVAPTPDRLRVFRALVAVHLGIERGPAVFHNVEQSTSFLQLCNVECFTVPAGLDEEIDGFAVRANQGFELPDVLQLISAE